jgi:hypothetical protein
MGHRKEEVPTEQKHKKHIQSLSKYKLVSLGEDEGLNLEVESRAV